MSATNRFHEIANDALVEISRHLPPDAKLALVSYTAGSPELDIVLKDQGLDPDEVVNTLRRRGGLSLDGDNAYKRGVCDVIFGAMAGGKQNTNPPPTGHWGQRFWDIGRAEGEERDHLRQELELVSDQRDALLDAAREALAVIPRIKPEGHGDGTQRRLAAAIEKATH